MASTFRTVRMSTHLWGRSRTLMVSVLWIRQSPHERFGTLASGLHSIHSAPRRQARVSILSVTASWFRGILVTAQAPFDPERSCWPDSCSTESALCLNGVTHHRATRRARRPHTPAPGAGPHRAATRANFDSATSLGNGAIGWRLPSDVRRASSLSGTGFGGCCGRLCRGGWSLCGRPGPSAWRGRLAAD